MSGAVHLVGGGRGGDGAGAVRWVEAQDGAVAVRRETGEARLPRPLHRTR